MRVGKEKVRDFREESEICIVQQVERMCVCARVWGVMMGVIHIRDFGSVDTSISLSLLQQNEGTWHDGKQFEPNGRGSMIASANFASWLFGSKIVRFPLLLLVACAIDIPLKSTSLPR